MTDPENALWSAKCEGAELLTRVQVVIHLQARTSKVNQFNQWHLVLVCVSRTNFIRNRQFQNKIVQFNVIMKYATMPYVIDGADELIRNLLCLVLWNALGLSLH